MPKKVTKKKVDNSLIEAVKDSIIKEQDAQVFYTKASGLAADPAVKEFFLGLRDDEIEHEKMLRAVLKDLKAGKLVGSTSKAIPKGSLSDMGIGRYLKKDIPRTTTTYQDALMMAMRREESAWRGYQKLAERSPTESLQDLFLLLAQTEVGHLRRLEAIYERGVLDGY